MAEQGGGQERTEDATPRRLRKLREQGNVPKSQDLNTVVILIGAFGILAAMIGFLGEQFRLLMEQAFQAASRSDFTNTDLLLHTRQAMIAWATTMGPYLLAVAVIALAVGFLQVGPVFSGEPLKMQMKRLNVVENMKNKFKVTTLVELGKNIVKMTLVFLLAYWVIRANLGDVLATARAAPDAGAAVAAHLVVSFMIRVMICFAAIAILDLMVQRWHYKKQNRMTKEEVKREYKEEEGDPLIRSMRRQLHQEMAMGDVRRAVAASDMVVVNPTEVAVALKYDDTAMAAPQVMAKGQRWYAQMIREIAEEHQIPIMRNLPLAWTLLELEVGDEIPETLYAAVAELLLLIYRMRGSSPDTR